MRLSFISTMTGSPWGGSEELWSKSALRLREAGHSVTALVENNGPHPKLEALARASIEVRYRYRPSRPLASAVVTRLVGKPRPDPDHAWLLAQRPHLVVISQGSVHDGLPWRQFCAQQQIPFVIVIQSDDDSLWFPDAEAACQATAYLAAKRNFFVCQHNWKLLERQLGVALPNSLVIMNPNKAAGANLVPWPADAKVVRLACVGRLEPAAKGQDVLLQVLARPEWRARPIELNFYGAGPQKKTLGALAKALCPQAKFHGHVENVEEIWRENHLLVLPSRREGMPLTLIEAMSCGRPAVVTDVGGNAELCEDGVTGFIAAAAAVGPLAAALERAWARRADWEQMGRAARERIRQVVPQDPVNEFFKILTVLATEEGDRWPER